MTFSTWFLLGLCLGYDPNDQEMTYKICKGQFDAKFRAVEVKEPWDDFERVYFNYQINRSL